jgi:hypothetical protein
VDRAGQQLVELVGWQVDELLGQRDDVAHTHAEEDLGGGVGVFAGSEVASELVALAWRAARFQLDQGRLGGGLRRHPEAALPDRLEELGAPAGGVRPGSGVGLLVEVDPVVDLQPAPAAGGRAR